MKPVQKPGSERKVRKMWQAYSGHEAACFWAASEEPEQWSTLGHALPLASVLPKAPEFHSDEVLLLGDNEMLQC